MKANHNLVQVLLALALVALVTTALPLPVAAGVPGTNSATLALPPIPEWPVIGPVLRWLGVASPTEETPTPTPDLPEYRISSYEDIDALNGIQRGERIRIIAAEDDLNAIILDAIQENVGAEAGLVLDVEPNLLSVRATADESLLAQYADDLPRQIQGDLDFTGAFRLEAAQCAPRVTIQKLEVNGWSFGLRLLAQGPINTRISEIWPDEICVERVLLMQNDVAVEGYYR
jgi:hypothetical protein